MAKAQHAIMRFAKYKGPEIGRIEAHDERTKENYASNPDIDLNKSSLNFHLVEPQGKYRAEAEKQIAAAGCRTRKDSVRVVETLITASPEFFKGIKRAEVKAYFDLALEFIKQHQAPETILSAVVHMDEKTPHMHLCFVPLTKDGRLSAKDILGNRKKLVWWQDEFWKHMVKKYPALERGESASETGREHIPPRIFKEAAHLNRQSDMIMQLLSEINPLNAKKKTLEIEALLEKHLPGIEKMKTQLKKYDAVYKQLKSDNSLLEKKLDASKGSIFEQLKTADKLRELEELRRTVEALLPELLAAYQEQRRSTQPHQGRQEDQVW